MAAAPTLVPNIWAWVLVGGSFALGGACVIWSFTVRPKLTNAGRIAALDGDIQTMISRRAALAGTTTAGRGPTGPSNDEQAALAALAARIRAAAFEPTDERKPSPHPRRTPTTV